MDTLEIETTGSCTVVVDDTVNETSDGDRQLVSLISSEDLQMSSNSKENSSEEVNGPAGVQVESFQIPHLRLVRESNYSTEELSTVSSIPIVKKELEVGDNEDDHYFNESPLNGLDTLPITDSSGINSSSNTEDGIYLDLAHLDENVLEDCNEIKQGTSLNKLKSDSIENPKSQFCCNCNTSILNETSTNKNFHEFLPLQYFDTVTGDYTDVQIIDALSEIFKIRWTCSSFGEIYKRDDLALCLECASTLAQLYRMYNQFAALAIKAKSFLSEVINFQKDLQLEDHATGTEDEGFGYKNSTETEYNPNAKWKRARRVKKVHRYIEEDESSDSDMENAGFILPTRRKKEKSKILVQDSENEHPSISTNNSIPLKKRGSKQTDCVQTSEDETDFAVNKIDVEDSFSAFEIPQMDDNGNENEEDEEDKNSSFQLLLKKLTNANREKGKSLKCKECKKEFKFPIQLRIHLNSKHHKDKIKMLRLVKEDSVEENKPKKRSRNTKSEAISRILEKSKSKCCSECGKYFPKSKDLARHVKSRHSLIKAGECDRCGKKFKTLGGLKIHYAAHVRDDNKYSCKDCGKKFRKQEALELHEKTDHEGFKPHVCTLCDKRFRLKDKLKLHMMVIHEKKKPFPCPKCEKSFRTKYHLKIHDVSQHIQGGDTSIGCSQCKRKFLDREALEKHIAVHEQEKPYVCSICSKGFHTSARLKLHEKSHQEVPSCLCPVCGRAYKHIRDLKLHEVVHQDESTYRFGCGDCPRRFYRIDLLRVHQSNEKHFASEVIGPTVSKSISSNKDVSYFQVKEGVDEEDDDENETDNDLPPPPKPKRRKKASPRQKSNKLYLQPPSEREMTVMHPHATVIYHPSSMVQLHLDQQNLVQGSGGIRQESSTVSTSGSNNLTLTAHHPRYSHEVQSGQGTYIMNHRDRQNLPHYSGIQIQPVSSTSHPHIQFGNNAVYTMRDVSGNSTLNVANGSGAVSASGAEQIGFDIITSFINNLG